jgi:hypothetical protein
MAPAVLVYVVLVATLIVVIKLARGNRQVPPL